MEEDTREMAIARRAFGYGRWEAPYWFIGPEEGKGPEEQSNSCDRVEAWYCHQRDGLCDCREFHSAIRDTTWHHTQPRLQHTWRSLILLLKTFLNETVGDAIADRESVRKYQRDQWGASSGETCVIELSGTAARSLAVSVDRYRFLDNWNPIDLPETGSHPTDVRRDVCLGPPPYWGAGRWARPSFADKPVKGGDRPRSLWHRTRIPAVGPTRTGSN